MVNISHTVETIFDTIIAFNNNKVVQILFFGYTPPRKYQLFLYICFKQISLAKRQQNRVKMVLMLLFYLISGCYFYIVGPQLLSTAKPTIRSGSTSPPPLQPLDNQRLMSIIDYQYVTVFCCSYLQKHCLPQSISNQCILTFE